VATFTGEALARYAGLPWEETTFAAADYYQDLCEICVWDNWGLLYQRETAPFREVCDVNVPLVDDILRQLEAEHRANHLDYEADQSAQLVAWLHVSTRTFDRFVATAERLDCDWWTPVTAMAETAVAAGRTQLAVDVFVAATSRPGLHRDFLARKCATLTGQSPSPQRHLRAVD